MAQGPLNGYLVKEKAPGVNLLNILNELGDNEQDVAAKGLAQMMSDLYHLAGLSRSKWPEREVMSVTEDISACTLAMGNHTEYAAHASFNRG